MLLIKTQNSNYINITDYRTIVAEPVYCTSGISKMLQSFFHRTCNEGASLSSCDIKSPYKNIHHDIFYKAIDC